MGGGVPAGLAGPRSGDAKKVTDFAKEVQNKPGDVNARRGDFEDKRLKSAADELAKDSPKGDGKPDPARQQLAENLRKAMDQKGAYDRARDAFAQGRYREAQAGKLGVDLSSANNGLRNQQRLAQTACRNCNNRSCVELGGVWIDEGFDPSMKCVVVKAQSDAYFRILEKQPKMKEVFKLGNYLVWVTPNKSALIIDAGDGKDKLDDSEIDALFVEAKEKK